MDKLCEAARMKTSAHEIALGMGVGTFIAFLPIFGFQTLLGIVLIFIIKMNKITTFIGIYLTNPITIPPVFTFNYFVGKLIVGNGNGLQDGISFFSLESLLAHYKPLLVGSIIVGIFAAVAAYFITYYIVLGIQKEMEILHIK